MIPCPGHNGDPCSHEFNYTHLQKAIERIPPVQHVQCPVAYEDVSVSGLLFGIYWKMQDAVLDRINDLEMKVTDKQEEILSELANLRELTQREFTNIWRREQSKIDSHCPNVFVLRPRDTSGWKKALLGQKIDLQLYCQKPGCWHPAQKGGIYEVENPANWMKKVAPYIKNMVSVLKYAAPLAGPWVAVAFPEYDRLFKHDIKLMEELVKLLPELEEDRELELAEKIGDVGEPERIGGAALRALRQLLEEKDPNRYWGGLKKILTPEGHYLWLCEHHAKEYRI